MRSLRSVTAVLISLIVSSFLLVGCGSNNTGKAEQNTPTNSANANGVAIKVGSESISQAKFNQKLDQQLQRIKQRLQRLPKSQRQKQLKRFRQRYKQQLASQYVTRLTLQHFVNQSDVTVSDSEVENRVNQIRNRFPSEQAMKKALQKQGVSIKSLRDRIRKQLRIQKYVENQVGEIEVTPEEAREYYKQNKEQFDQPEKVKARHILIKDDTGAKKRIQSLRDQLEQGASFEELARKESEGPSAKRGGDLGFITRDRMVKPFSDAAFNLSVGEISDPVKTRYGWHLIKVEDRKAGTSPSYDDIEDTIVQQVKTQKRQEATRNLIEKLKSQVTIVNNVVSDTAAMRSKSAPAPSR